MYDMNAFGRMDAGDRKEALGLEATKHLPLEGAPVVVVHGIQLWCEANGAVRGYKRQRVRAGCPECHKVFAAGNLAQHHKVHTEEGRAWLARKEERRQERQELRAKRGW